MPERRLRRRAAGVRIEGAGISGIVSGRRETDDVAFSQQSGPPASRKQVEVLLDLLQSAGHVDFRDARGPMAFTQRQAAGKFTAAEADSFIEQLQVVESAHMGDPSPAAPARRLTAEEKLLQGVRTELLAAELQRRGWIVVEP